MAAALNNGTTLHAVARGQLYEQIWAVPAAQLALHYGLSDVGLAKACKRYRIPRPPRGYWARLRAGKPVKRTPLPAVKDPGLETVYMKGWAMPQKAVEAAITTQRSVEPPAGDGAATLHPLALAARDQLRSADPDHDGLVNTDHTSALKIRVSPACIDRAIAAFNTFIDRWQSRGGDVAVKAEANGGEGATAVAVGSDALQLRLDEHLDEAKPLTDPTRRTGMLCFWINGDPTRELRRRWSDTKTQRLERLINPMIETLLHALEVKRLEREDRDCEQRQLQRVQALRQARTSARNNEFYRRQDFMDRVNRWHEARRIREYLAAVQADVEAGRLRISDAGAFRDWLAWCHEHADTIDPHTDRGPQQHEPAPPTNTPAAELDLTSTARAVVELLGVPDSDALWQKSEEEVREACDRGFGRTWNEITRVLEALGYDVTKRRELSHWW